MRCAHGDRDEEHIALSGAGKLVVGLEGGEQARRKLLCKVSVCLPRLVLFAHEEILARRQRLICDNNSYLGFAQRTPSARSSKHNNHTTYRGTAGGLQPLDIPAEQWGV